MDKKYIVYITTNSVNNKIYIGVHGTYNVEKFDGYLGCGVNIKDRSTYKFSKTPFEAAVNKYGPDKFIRKTIKVFDTLEEALDLEKKLVNEDFIRRKDTYNITLGGNLPPIKTKIIYQYDLEGNFIKEWPSITEASLSLKCSNTSIGKAIHDRTPSSRYLWTEIKYEKLDLDTFKIDENKTITYLYDSEGNFVKEFVSMSECAKYINSTTSKISESIKGKYCINKEFYCSDYKYDMFPIPERKNYKDMKLYQYDLEGNFIKEWENYNEVSKYFGKNIGIHAAIRLGRSCEGFQWSWEKLPCMKKLVSKTKARKVGQYNKSGELVNTFNSVREAKKIVSGVPQVLSGNRKSAGGYFWKYLDE